MNGWLIDIKAARAMAKLYFPAMTASMLPKKTAW